MTDFQWRVVLVLCRVILDYLHCTDQYGNLPHITLEDKNLLREALKRGEEYDKS